MIKINYLMLIALLGQAISYAVTDIENYLERTPMVEDKQEDWIFELKNKDKESYLLTIVNGTRVIADELSLLPAHGKADSSLGYVRISSATGFNPLREPTHILVRNKNNTIVYAWYIKPGASKIFVSYEDGELTAQRSGVLQGWYAAKTTSGLPIKDNVKQSNIKEEDPEYVVMFIEKYVKSNTSRAPRVK